MSPDLSRQEIWAGRYRLSPLSPADAGEIYQLFADPEVVEFMDIPPLGALSGAREIVEWAGQLAREGRGLRWGVRRGGQGPLIGTVGFNLLERDRGRRGEIAYDLARAEWGRGVMSEILPHVMDYGFLRLGLRRLEAFVTVGNLRSCGLLERHGFICEGTLRQHGYWKGQFWDQWLYARLSD